MVSDDFDLESNAGRTNSHNDRLYDGLGANQPTPARGSPLPTFRPSPLLQRTRFAIDLDDASTATIDIDHTLGRASFFLDDRLVQTSDMPVHFSVGSDSIDVVAGKYGMQRIHLVRADGRETLLYPAPGTPEHWRARLGRRHPRVARVLAVSAVVVLTTDLFLLAPQLLQLITHMPVWADHFASFTSPINLSAELNTALTVTAGLAGVERALTFRNHRLLDIETDGIDR